MSNNMSIAVIGMAGRFPKAADIEAFWQMLCEGKEGITLFTDEELLAAGVSAHEINHPDYVKARAVLKDVDLFDAEFFGYSRREAEWMDPQHRLFLEHAHAALEDAGYACRKEPLNVGVFAGCSSSSYLLLNLLSSSKIDAGVGNMQVMIGNDKDYLASRTSYKLNLTGPSLAIQTACSTSLTAVHVACQSLLGGECDMALAGGVCVSLPQISGYRYEIGSIASPDGHCRPFDVDAKGTNGGSGIGVVLLKRLSDAIEDGDNIYAVIRGSAINNDGTDKVGFTAPSQHGQATVIAEALAVADVSAADIGYVEAHGTGTPVGDPIEVAALTQAYRETSDKNSYCALGAVKANVGHLDAAAGITGFIKTVLALSHRKIPVTLNFKEPNPKLRLDQSPFYVPTETIDWKPVGDQTRRAGVSSFGIGGSNVHVVLEEAPVQIEINNPGPELLVFSARSPEALDAMRENFACYLEKNPSVSLANAAYTLQIGRAEFKYRYAIVAQDPAHAITKLRTPFKAIPANAKGVACLLTGQGTQLVNVGRKLYESEPSFRECIDNCSLYLETTLGRSLAELLYPSPAKEREAEITLASTKFAQPALFTIEFALMHVLKHYGVEPRAMLGHSLGQYCAATVAGIFSLHDALKLVAKRGELMESLPEGVMLAVQMSASEALDRINGLSLDLAADNAPDSCVIAGAEQEIVQLENRLSADGIAYRRSTVNRAFHSSLTDSCLDALSQVVASIKTSQMQIPLVCNVTGEWLSSQQSADPQYWARHTRETVLFRQGLKTLADESDLCWLETGPAPVLAGLVRRNKIDETVPLIPTFPGRDQADLLNCLGQLWQAGITIDWQRIPRNNQNLKRLSLPTYPFESKRYWVEAENAPVVARSGAESSSRLTIVTKSNDEVLSVLYTPRWIPADIQTSKRKFEQILFFDPRNTLSQDLKEAFRQKKIEVVCIDHLDQLSIVTSKQWDAIIYGWSLTRASSIMADETLETSFYQFMDVAKKLASHKQDKSATLFVLTQYSTDALPNDLVDPFRAAILGAAKEIPREVLWLGSKCIDVASQTTANEILAELYDAGDDAVVALRDTQRLAMVWEPLSKNFRANSLPLKKSGVYWLLGGTGGVGMAIARYLAKHYQAKLVLSSRYAGKIKNEQNIVPFEWLQQRFSQLDQASGIIPITHRGDLAKMLSDYSAALVCEYFVQAGVSLGLGQCMTLRDLESELKIKPEFVKFLRFMVQLLVRTGLAEQTDDGLQIRAKSQPSVTLSEEILRIHPGFKGMVTFMRHCAIHYQQVLSGQLAGVSVLYPDGTAKMMSDAVAQTDEHSCMGTQIRLLVDWSKKIAEQSCAEPIRILEIGGGHGMVTDAVLPQLGDVEYWFTDIGKSFVDNRRRLAQEQGEHRIICEVLDITRDPVSQGFKQEQYDWILAMNVVHATADVEHTLKNMRQLLKPGGGLILLETVRQEDWVDMVWGVTPGWWVFTDDQLRSTSPLMSPEKWRSVLTRSGFEHFNNIPEDFASYDASLMFAQRPDTVQIQQINFAAQVKDLEILGAQVQVMPVDVADQSAMHVALLEITKRFGTINGVFNCSMVLEDSLLPNKTRNQAKRVLRPKVIGMRVLDQIFKDVKLDFLALSSSLSAFDPAPGQFDYAAANAVVDAYARKYRGSARHVVSINWNRWRESGFVARMAAARNDDENGYVKHISLDSATQWELSEHRIDGVSLLPGTALIEQVVMTALEQGLHYPLQIENLQFVSPAWVSDVRQSAAFVSLKSTQTSRRFEFVIAVGELSARNAFGAIKELDQCSSKYHDLSVWQSRCFDQEHSADAASARPPTLGARWNCLGPVRFNSDKTQALAHITLDDAFRSDLNSHPLHPAMLDVASGFALSGSYLPFAIRCLTIRRALPASFFSFATIQYQGKDPLLDIILADESGEELMHIEGYLLRPPKFNYALRMGKPGFLETLTLQRMERAELGPDEIEIAVVAAGLNFKDILLASGMLMGYGDISVKNLPLGTECAGRIVRLGSRAALQWQVGDHVLASGAGALADSMVVNSQQVFSKPDRLSFAEAATLPTAFATAYYALKILGNIQPGQRVLIHSATGGVGLAAVQIAQSAGAEIFATAGSDIKRTYLREMGIEHVMNSRDLDFVEYIQRATDGQGVDLVLNALPGEYLLASLNLVAPGGLFLELGKRDIQSANQLPLSVFDKAIGFIAIEYSPVHRTYSRVMQALLDDMKQGVLKPLPTHVYALTDAVAAFQFMQESKHIGKIILAPDPVLASKHSLSNHGLQVNTQVADLLEADDLTDDQGLRVLTLALQSREAQIAVTRNSLKLAANKSAQSSHHEALTQGTAPGAGVPRVLNASIAWETPTQQKLAAIWLAVLGQEVTSLDDNFFDLRGDSLLAISVLGKIRQQFNVTLNPADIFTAPTLRQLAALIQPQDASSLLSLVSKPLPATLVPLSPGGHRTPLFLSPPIMGTLFPYLQLAQLLGGDRPIYGLSLRIPDSGSFSWSTVEEQAQLYIEDIKAAQPDGPYLIGGWSFGAVVAFEIVRQLEAQGDKVAFFAAIDYPSHTSSQTSLLDFVRFFGFSTFKNLLSYLRDYFYLRSKSPDNNKHSFFRNLIDHAVIGKVLTPEAQQQFAAQPGMQALMQFYRANTVALSKYKPTRSYQSSVDVFRTDDHNMKRHNDSLEWDTATSGRVNVHKIGGTHMTILRSPHVEQLSVAMNARLTEIDGS